MTGKNIKISSDYRAWILFKYIYVGGADVCFWWTVWGIADYLWPMDITADGGLSYLRGYILIILANLLYLVQRFIFRDVCERFYETRQNFLYPAVIVTEKEVIENKPFKFIVLRKYLAFMIWMLVVGYIQMWRGLFATFYYVVDLLHIHYNVSKVLSSIAFQLFVGVTLAFTQRNNAINLCPTHKIYKYDEIEEMDGLFNLHILDNFLTGNAKEAVPDVEQAVSCSQEQQNVKRFKPLHSGFDLPQYTARKISTTLHKPNDFTTAKIEKPQNDTNNHNNFFVSTQKQFTGVAVTLNGKQLIDEKKILNKGYQNNGYVDDKKLFALPEKTEFESKDMNERTTQAIPESTKLDHLSIIEHIRRASVRSSRRKRKDVANTVVDTNLLKETEFPFNHCNLCRCVSALTYLFTIHHRQVFLHIFGGMFWSTTWSLYDFATESVFTKTACDLPGLVLIAIFCHCINHLVLFRLKETSSKVHWKTFWEFFCGLFTVCLWASTWYIWDIIADATGVRHQFQIVMHLISFLSLMFFNVAINTAL